MRANRRHQEPRTRYLTHATGGTIDAGMAVLKKPVSLDLDLDPHQLVVGAGGRAHSFLEMHLVTALQGGYSLRLFEGYTRKLARRWFRERHPETNVRAPKCRTKIGVGETAIVPAVSTPVKCYAGLAASSRVRGPCG